MHRRKCKNPDTEKALKIARLAGFFEAEAVLYALCKASDLFCRLTDAFYCALDGL